MAIQCDQSIYPKNTCNVDNAAEDLEWLAAEIEEKEASNFIGRSYIQQSVYKNATVFIFNLCCSYCNYVIPVYNCSGEGIGLLGNGEDDIPNSVLEDAVIIWEQEDGEC